MSTINTLRRRANRYGMVKIENSLLQCKVIIRKIILMSSSRSGLE